MFELKISALKNDIVGIVSGGQFEFASEYVDLFVEFRSLHLVHLIVGISWRVSSTFDPKGQAKELVFTKLQLVSVLLG